MSLLGISSIRVYARTPDRHIYCVYNICSRQAQRMLTEGVQSSLFKTKSNLCLTMELTPEAATTTQRFEEGYRLVAGCVPYRRGANECLEVLMISSKSGSGLVFPKGGWEQDESVQQAAGREAMEEAGVQGLVKYELGTYNLTQKGLCKAHMFALEVTEELSSWPEERVRRRQWISLRIVVPNAKKHCRHEWMLEALWRFVGCVDKQCGPATALSEQVQHAEDCRFQFAAHSGGSKAILTHLL